MLVHASHFLCHTSSCVLAEKRYSMTVIYDLSLTAGGSYTHVRPCEEEVIYDRHRRYQLVLAYVKLTYWHHVMLFFLHFLISVNTLNFAQLFYGLLSLHFACFRCQLKVCEVFSPAILSLYGLNLFTKSYGFQKLKHLIDSYHETCNLSKFGLLILDLPDISFAQTKFHWKTYNTIFFYP